MKKQLNGEVNGEAIKDVRKLLGLTQVELAEKLGVRKQLISLWETNKKKPADADIIRLSEILENHDNNIAIETGKQLKSLRQSKGHTCSQVGNVIGLKNVDYAKIESGKRDITIVELQKLAVFYNVELTEMLKGEITKVNEVINVEKTTDKNEKQTVVDTCIPEELMEILAFSTEKRALAVALWNMAK